jgi:hypothetical protein
VRRDEGSAVAARASGGSESEALCEICRRGSVGSSFHNMRGQYVLVTARQIASAAPFQWSDNVQDPSLISKSTVMCRRRGCLYDLTHRKRKDTKRSSTQKSSRELAAACNPPPAVATKPMNGRICTTVGALLGLLQFMLPYGNIIDICGSTADVIFKVLTGPDYKLNVKCNDINSRLSAHTHVDASDVVVAVPALLKQNGGEQFEFAITSPPYTSEEALLNCLDTMSAVSSVGYAAKLSASFLHPTLGRHDWLQANKPTSVIFMRNTPSLCSPMCHGGEVWVIWIKPEFVMPNGRIVNQDKLDTFLFLA